MKKIILPFFCLLVMVSFSGCGLMEDSFKLGFIVALIVAGAIGLLIWIFHITYKTLAKYFPAVRALDGFWDE
jgi:hypothetical protein